MRVWRRTRTEMAGAWRSLRYDMGRRPFEAPADGPDVTSTGMSTFAGTSWDYGPEPTEMPVAGRMPAPRRRTPRRAVAMSAFGLLTVVGAAGSYLVVVNGLVPMRDEGPAAAATVPPVATATADAAIGPSLRSPRVARTSSPADPAPVIGTRPPRRTDVVVAPLPPPRTTKPLKPTRPDCRCGNPPVPTPTAPASSPSPTPSAPMSPSASASNSDDPSADPSESPEPRKSWKSGHHRRPH